MSKINIEIDESNFKIDSDLDLGEVIFWLEMVKFDLLNSVFKENSQG